MMENGAFPDVDELLEQCTKQVADEMSPFVTPGSPISSRIGELLEQGYKGIQAPVTLEGLFEHIAIARGLHEAASRARTAGNPEWADFLHGLGQLFLSYASGDVSALRDIFVSAVAADALDEAAAAGLPEGTLH